MDRLKNNAVLEFGGSKYKVVEEDGRVSLVRYNEKFKLWVRINFSENLEGNRAEKYIIDLLSGQYIDNLLGSQSCTMG